MRRFGWFLLASVLCLALLVGAAAESTVYVDGTGKTDKAYLTLADAAAAVDDGGTIIVCGDTSTPTGASLQLPEKALTIKGEGGAVLTLCRGFKLGGDTTFDDITIKNGASTSYDTLYACGHDLTVENGVVSQPNGSNYFRIAAGGDGNKNFALNGTKLTLRGGTWRAVSAGNYNGATAGSVTLLLDGATVTGNLYLSNMLNGDSTASVDLTVQSGSLSIVRVNSSATYNGTAKITLSGGTVKALKNLDATVDLPVGGSVTVESVTSGTVTTKAPEGYTVVESAGVYTLKAEGEQPQAADTVYVDGVGTAQDAYMTLAEAADAVADGGTVVISADHTTPTAAALTLPEKELTITSANGASLTLSRALRLGGDTTFTNIRIVNGMTSNYFIYARGHKLIIGGGVTTAPNTAASPSYITLYAGSNNEATNGGYVEIRSGTWRTVYAGTYNTAMTGKVDILLDGGALTNAIQPGNSNGGTNTAAVAITVKSGSVGTSIAKTNSFTGTCAVTLTGGSVTTLSLDATVDLTAGGSVAVTNVGGTVTTKAPEGYEVILQNGVYTLQKTQQEQDLTPKTVYLDGTGKTAGAYTSLSAALADMPGGGTVILCGDTEISAATALPKTGEVLITSVYEEEDYRETAALKFYANLTLGGDTVFRDVVLERSKPTGGNLFLIAAGNRLTVDTGVICLNYTALQWISLVAGNYNAPFEGDTYITVKSGHFRNVFGGNYYGAFVGDSHVEITGGVYDNAVTGGSFNSDFTGDTHVYFGGEATLITSGGTPAGLIGGTLGETGKAAHTHQGNIYVTVCGDSAPSYIFGASRNGNMTTVGDVEVIIKDRAYMAGAVYGGGYSGKLEGNASVTFYGGEVQGYVFGGGYTGDVTGNTSVTLEDGKLCYYLVAEHAAGSSPAGTRSAYAGGYSGKVGGSAAFTMHGGSVYGNVYSGGLDTGASVGSASATFTGGTVFGAVRGENCTVDLSAGGSFTLGVSSDLASLIGGGRLTLAAGAALTVGTLQGVTELVLNGIPLPKTYLTVGNALPESGISYIAQGAESLVQSGSTYAIDFDGAYPTVEVTVTYKEGCVCELRRGGAKYLKGFLQDIPSETATETTFVRSTYRLTPGLYTAYVRYPGSNWRYKAIYVFGNAPAQTVAVEFDAADTVGHEGKNANLHTDEIIAKYYEPSNIEGYFTPDTPYFNKREGSSVFTTNAEMMEHLYAKAAACDYMYLFDDAHTTEHGYTVPVAVFTKDEIPAGATLAEIAEIVKRPEGREILLFTGQVHGNEPCGGEGCIAMISEMCTSYGESVLDGTNIGAVIIVPRVNPEGAHDFTRESKYMAVNKNLNRDYMLLEDAGTAAVVNAANLFMPTFYVDCHEAYHEPYWSEGDLIPDVYDIGISFNTPIGGGLAPSKQSLYGDLAALNGYGEELAAIVTDKLDALGIRTSYYEKRSITSMADKFFPHTGVYGIIFEVPGIYGGPADIGRRSFVQMAGLKAVIALAIEEDGKIYAGTRAAQKQVTESAQIYDDRQPVVVHHAKAYIQKYDEILYWNDPLVGADGVVRYADNPVGQDNYNLAIKYRTRPTAYVFRADAPQADKVLQTLDRQAIPYFPLPAGTTLSLAQYSGDATQATVGEEQPVTLSAPAYIVPVDGYKANVAANLFEPENHDTAEGSATFVQAGWLLTSDIYRTTESFIAAKLGLSGTYLALGLPEGKTVESVTVNGEDCAVHTEDGQVFVPVSDAEYYPVALSFTDGTSKTVHIGTLRGDLNGNGELDIEDALLLLRGILNETELPASADVTGNGSVDLGDVLRILKNIVK